MKKDPQRLSAQRAKSASAASVSDMQGVAQRAQGGFLHRFTQRGVGMNGAGHIFQARAHFQ
ncbi:hypothetical protein D9M73_211450 [compost metagenome]